MRLFEVDQDYTLRLNKEWILLIPEFAEIFKRDKGSKGDTQARLKLRARRELAFVYFMCDFASPLRYWEATDKKKEALIYTELTEKDIDEKIVAAINKYEQLMDEASRSLRTLRAMSKGLDALDNYMEQIDFTEKDGDGRLLHSPDKLAQNISRMNKVYEEYDKFSKRVDEELKQGGSSIRGTAIKGQNEDKIRPWSEENIKRGSQRAQGIEEEDAAVNPNKNAPSMMALGKQIHSKKNTFTEEELQDGLS